MPLSVKLYGDLREKSSLTRSELGIPNTLNIEISGSQTVLEILKELNIDKTEISHIFVNGIYSGSGKIVNDGDRIGIFPKRMGIMFLEITKKKSIYIKTTLHDEFKKFGPHKAVIDMPEGSTLNSLLKKFKISNQKEKVEIIANGKPTHDMDYILKDWDNIAIFPL